jgi:hypothetical protein
MSYALSKLPALASAGLKEEYAFLTSNSLNSFAAMRRRFFKWLNESNPGRCFKVVIKFAGVILFGAMVFYADDGQYFGDKYKFMANEEFNARTFVDALYFASVISTSVGYGHLLRPVTDSAKCFLIFYFFFSTIFMGGLVAEVVDIYVNGYIGGNIINTLIDSTTYVHTSDFDRDGRVTEAEYVLFKLQQMLKVDTSTIDRLYDRYHKLDVGGRGMLDVGIDIPSAAQAQELQRIKLETGCNKTIVQMWQEIQRKLDNDGAPLDSSLCAIWRKIRLRQQRAPALKPLRKRDQVHLKITRIHDFWWSRQLWAMAAVDIAKSACLFVFVYCGLAYYLLAHREGMHPVDGLYFLVATVTTVGFGDFAPTTQETRACAIVLVPIGLVVFSIVLSFISASATAKVPKAVENKYSMQDEWASTALQSAFRGMRARALNLNPSMANRSVVKSNDSDSQYFGILRKYYGDISLAKDAMSQCFHAFVDTPTGQCFNLLFKLAAVVTIGAIFFKLYPEEEALGLTWVDAFYLAVQTSTTVGYGDITMTSTGGKVFMSFYMLFSTVVVGKVLGGFVDLYVNGFVGARIDDLLLESTTWVHKADGYGNGQVSESNYILFKLQQMQKLDSQMLDRLIDRYHELDVDGSGYLNVGVEIPSAAQVTFQT